jgi:transcriptional regulator with XRE-family HTH domain
LGAELRELRAATKLSTRAVAERLGWAYSTINRIETGKRKTTTDEVSALLVVYDVKGEERDRLIELTREVDQPGWWETSGSPWLRSQLTALIAFENTASLIASHPSVRIPGLLQTPDYARALLRSAELPEYAIESMVAMRVGRQTTLTKPGAPEYVAVIDEAALRRPVGGAATMADQLSHLLKQATRTNITIQAVPFSLGAHTGLDGAFLVLAFPKASTVVHLENKRGGVFLDQPNDVHPYVEALSTLQKVALSPDETIGFIQSIAVEYEQME